MQKTAIFTIFAFALFMGACASTTQLVQSPIVGKWSYVIESPEGVFRGEFTVAETDTTFSVSLLPEEEDESIPAENVEFDDETQTLTFSFENPDYGTLEVSVVYSEEGMTGVLYSVRYEVDAPITATRMEE